MQQSASLLWASEVVASKVCLSQALPQWSQQALQQHMRDAREVKTLEQLENGGTGDDIWDAMQHQLKTYGTAPLVLVEHRFSCQTKRQSDVSWNIC